MLELTELVVFYARNNADGLREMVRSRILGGEHFGKLDLGGMDFGMMFAEEISDAIAYLAGERLHARTKAR